MQPIVKYAFGWRILHWGTAALVIVTIPIGLTMASRADANIFDAVTNTLHAAHKAIGVTLLSLVILRIIFRFRAGVPAYPADMARGLKNIANSVHYGIYALLVLTPVLGWAGITAYPALTIAGSLSLPPLPLCRRARHSRSSCLRYTALLHSPLPGSFLAMSLLR